MWNFFRFLDDFDKPLPCTAWRLDDELSVYFEELCPAGDGLSQAQSTLAAVNHFAPQLRGHTPGAWKKLKTWRRHELLRRAPPIPPAVVRGVAGLAWVQGRLDVALGVLIRFHCMRRGSEVLRLKFCDCVHFCGTVVLDLGFTKSGSRKGIREQVTITDKSLASLLQSFSRRCVSSERLVCMTPCNFRKYFSRLLSFFRLSKEGYTLHSLRRGGATHFSR